MPLAWLRRKVRQVYVFFFRGMGRILSRYRETVRSLTRYPKRSSSPWILGAPHVGFSVAIRRMRVRICSLALGRPPRDFQVQKSRYAFRCQRITVAGFTKTSVSIQPFHRRSPKAHSARSKGVKALSGSAEALPVDGAELYSRRSEKNGIQDLTAAHESGYEGRESCRNDSDAEVPP